MIANDEPIVAINFNAVVIDWRGPAPFFFAAVPADYCGEIAWAARSASYGWGVIPVRATIGDVAFSTSLFPKGDGYLVPLKAAIRHRTQIELGDNIALSIQIFARNSFT